MKHYGDITKISGYDVPIVDVITGGSPCQDLSVAGKRAGLEGERSKAHGMGYEEEKAPTLNTTMNAGVLCLNDQGGSQMSCSNNISGTLRAQENGHQPIIMDGFDK